MTEPKKAPEEVKGQSPARAFDLIDGDAERDMPGSRWKEPVDRMGRPSCDPMFGSGR